jgi:molybdate transport system regulatory protein
LRDAEAAIGVPLIVTASGGAKGGGTKLSATGRDVVARYRRIEQIASRAAGADLKALGNAAGGAGCGPTPRKI